MNDSSILWEQKNATLSDKSAEKELSEINRELKSLKAKISELEVKKAKLLNG